MCYLPPVMMEETTFCPRCSARLEMKEVNGAQRPRCPSCGRVIYYDPKLAATVVVERDDRVLMVRRAIQPGIGLWSLPGGYVDRGEVVEKAAAREVLEETGLHVNITGLLGLFSEEGHPVVLAAFNAQEVGGEEAKPGRRSRSLGSSTWTTCRPWPSPETPSSWRRGRSLGVPCLSSRRWLL